MGIILALAPFIVFAVADHLVGTTSALIAGAVVAALLLGRDLLRGRSAKVLEVGTVILFGSLAVYAVAGGPAWSVIGVRLLVDAGLLVIVLVSMAIRRPFTLQYAREQVPREYWDRPEFVRTSYIITLVWAAAFLVMVLADALLLFAPSAPIAIAIGAIVVAFLAAVQFTAWYPKRVRARAAALAK